MKRKPKAKSRMPDWQRRELHKAIILDGKDPLPGRNPTKLIGDLCAIIRDMDQEMPFDLKDYEHTDRQQSGRYSR